MSATFFPREVRVATDKLEAALSEPHFDGSDDAPIVRSAGDLVSELRRWEREWKAGRARLVPQVEAKANGEGGL